MLSWICPECGRENDPAFQECPGCTPGVVLPQTPARRRAGRREPPLPSPASFTFDTDCVTAPFIDPKALGLSPAPAYAPTFTEMGRRVQRSERRQDDPASREASRTFEMDCATAPFIDPRSLGLSAGSPFAARPHDRKPTVESASTPVIDVEFLPMPSALASSVEWQPRTRVAPARPLETGAPISHEERPAFETGVAAPPMVPDVPLSAPVALAPSVDWQPRTQVAPARPRESRAPLSHEERSTFETGLGAPLMASTIEGEPRTRIEPAKTLETGTALADEQNPAFETRPAGPVMAPDISVSAPAALARTGLAMSPETARATSHQQHPAFEIDLSGPLMALDVPLSAPAALARSVEWQPRTQMGPANLPVCPPTIAEGALKLSGRTDSPAMTALEVPVTTALALAPQVDGPPADVVFRTLALLDRYNPLPVWSTAVRHPVRPDALPDHSSVLGMESDLLHLLEALRQSPNCPLLDGGQEAGLLPARVESRWLARPQDLEYIPTPRRMAPPVPWHPMVRASNAAAAGEDVPAVDTAWPERGIEMPRTRKASDEVTALSPRVERLLRLWVRPDRRMPATGRARPVGPVAGLAAGMCLPAQLRGFHENGIVSRPFATPRVHHKSSVPGWMVTGFAAVVVMLSLWMFGTSSFADRFTFTHAEAAAPSDAAQSAFPTMSKYVEVTGVRASVDTKTSEIRYVVVNHSAADLPPFLVSVKLRPKHGNATICAFSTTVQGMGPNESREMKTTIPRELHSYDLPEWRDLRVEAHVTAK